MKKAANSVRIGLIRRRSITPNLNEDELSSDIQQQTNYEFMKKQRADRRISRSAPIKEKFQHQQRIHTLETSNIPHLHDVNEVHTNTHRYPKTPNSPLPSSSPQLQREITTTNLNEIPTKTKWSTKKKILVGVSAALVLAAIITIPIVLGILLTRSTEVISTTKSTTTTTTISPTVVSAEWSFDNTVSDLYNVYNGTLINGATYFSNNASGQTPFVGHGRTLNVISTSSQSFLVSTPFFNLSYTSFTIEAWIYPSLTTGDRGIFGQCQCSTCTNQCFYLILRSNRLYVGFTLNDLSSSTSLSSGWHHIAFVYNYETQQQILYLDGVQDAIKSNAQPYQGKNGSIQIGSTQISSTTNFFHGCIDNVMVTTRAKSSVEILRSASLIAYYSFDLPNPNVDSGPNGLNGASINTVTVVGRVNEAMRFLGSSSYFQAYGFYQVPFGLASSKPFSISMWINPSSVSTSAFVQFTATFGSSCSNFLGIYSSSSSGSTGQIYMHSIGFSSFPILFGPFVAQNTWTHISSTLSSTTGYSLYVNGNLYITTGSGSYSTSSWLAYLIVGYSFGCSTYTNGAYQGSIDEIYVHNRELSQSEITALANP